MPREPILVSFSGLDGAGKTTQIRALCETIDQLGLASVLITFWDDVVVGSHVREHFVHRVLGSERGVGAPGRPVLRRDKNISTIGLTVMRHLLYLADSVSLRIMVYRASRRNPAVIVVDRYIYDELVNLSLGNRFSAVYARLLASVAPRPQLAFLLDTDPAQARARKPEYPLEFMYRSRRSYFRLVQLLGTITVIPALDIEDAKRAVLSKFLRALGRRARQAGVTGAVA